MKTISNVLAFAFVLLALHSCDRKSCENVICNTPNSTCVEGTCYCRAGYEGDNCDILSYEKYVGSYNVSENCTTTFSGFVNQYYSSSISPTSQIDVISINNFGNRGLPVNVVIVDATYLVIPDRNYGAIDVSGGEGFYEYINRIRFEYNYSAGTNFHACTAIFTKF